MIYIENDITIAAYNTHLQQYIDNTPHDFSEGHRIYLEWLNTALGLIGKRGEIFEIGSGHGRAARYIESQGYSITRSDASTAFVDYLNQRGETACVFNVLKHELPKKYDMILANAVIPHFTPENLSFVLKKVWEGLNPNGLFAFDAKEGDGERWIEEKDISPRYSYYWKPKELIENVRKHGYNMPFLKTNIPGGNDPSCLWTHIIAERI